MPTFWGTVQPGHDLFVDGSHNPTQPPWVFGLRLREEAKRGEYKLTLERDLNTPYSREVNSEQGLGWLFDGLYLIIYNGKVKISPFHLTY